MLALRLILGAGIGLIVITLLGYALSHDRRWLRYTSTLAISLLALTLLILIFLAIERLILVI